MIARGQPPCVTKELLLFFERLLLCLGPAVFAFLCYDTFKDLEPSPENKNAGAFLLLAFGWFSQWKEIWGLVARRRGRAWAAVVAYCGTMLVAGFLFFTWWPRDWAAWWVIIPTVLALAFILSGDEPAGKTAGPQSEPDTQPGVSGTPVAPVASVQPAAVGGPTFVPEPPRLRVAPPKPRRKWLLAVGAALLLFVVLGGAAGYLFSGPGGARLREQWRAYLGSGDAQLALAWRYREGDGQAQNFGKAAYWLERAAKNGVVRAHYDFAVLSYYGLGVPSDPGKARGHLEQAVAGDYSPALTMLGLMARDADQDQERAMTFWKTAAEAGDPWAEYLLGTAFLARRGESEGNIIMALYWLELARRDGVEPIKGLLQHVWATVPDEDQDHVAEEVFTRLDDLPTEETPPEPAATPTP